MQQHEDENTSLTRLPELAQPLLQFDLAAEIELLHREDSWQRGTGRSSRTLVKQPDFRVVLVAMKEATEIRAPGRWKDLNPHNRWALATQVAETRLSRFLLAIC